MKLPISKKQIRYKFPFLANITKAIALYGKSKKSFNGKISYFPKNFTILDSPTEKHLFTGYYDISPFHPIQSNKLLAYGVNSRITSANYCKNPIKMFIVNIDNKHFDQIGESYSWNWQQGCKAMWLNEKNIIYNVYNKSNDDYQCDIFNTESRTTSALCDAAQIVINNDKVLCINYKVLKIYRPDYGYFCHKNTPDNTDDAEIKIFDVKKQKYILNTSIRTLKSLLYTQSQAKHKTKFKCNHFIVNKAGKYVIFLLRYYKGNVKNSDIILLNLENHEYKMLIHESNCSHFCWVGDNNIFFTSVQPKRVRYNLYSLKKNMIIRSTDAKSDGHPFVGEKNVIYIDSYPIGPEREVYLWKLGIDDNWSNKEILRYNYPIYANQQYRCDMHPALSYDQKLCKIDLIVNGKRVVGLLKI